MTYFAKCASLLLLVLAIPGQCYAAEPEPKLDPKLEALAKQLKDPTLIERLKALDKIAKLGQDAAPLAKQLCEATLDPSPRVAQPAMALLLRLRPDLSEPLQALLDVKHPLAQLSAVEKLGGMKEMADPVLPLLYLRIKQLEANEQMPAPTRTRFLQCHLEAVGRITGPSPETVKELTKLTDSKRSSVIRSAAISAFGTLAESNEDLQKQLLPVVGDGLKDPGTRLASVGAAGHLGSEAKGVLEALDELKTDKVEEVRVAAIATIAGIEGKPEPIENLDARAKLRVRLALDWIARNQQKDGSWTTGMGQNGPAILVTTAFCGLTLMTDSKQYQPQIDKAAVYVMQNLIQGPKPAIRLPPELDQTNWNVGIGGFFVCEFYAAKKRQNPNFKSAQLQEFVEKLAEETFKRMEGSGGWGHTPRVKNPLGYIELEIVSIWMLAELGSAQKHGAKVPKDDLEKALKFIEECCNAGKGDVGYSPNTGQKGFGSPGRTGGTLFSFASVGQRKHPLFPKMVESYKGCMKDSDDGHGSVSLGFLGSALGAKTIGDKDWDEFRKRFFAQIVANTNLDGSFHELPGRTALSRGGADKGMGAAYNTALYSLILSLDRCEWTVFLAEAEKK